MRLPSPTASFKPPPAGTFPAICYRVIDLGTQSSVFKGKTKRLHKVMLSWEIHDDEAKMDDGQPMSIHQRYTWSMNEKSVLRRDLASWRGKDFTEADFGDNGFDIRNLLGKACLLTITHKDKDGSTYANMTAVSKLPKGLNVPAQVNASVYLWLTPTLFNRDAFSKLSDSLQDVIKSAPEYTYVSNPQGAGRATEAVHDSDADDDEDLPF